MSVAKSQTKQITLRLGSSLVAELDSKIISEGHYANKPDFLAHAIRLFYEYNLSVFSSYSRDLDKLLKLESGLESDIDYMHAIARRLTAFSQAMLLSDLTSGTLEIIVIRLPEKFYDKVQEYIDSTGFYKNIQIFTRYAILYTLMVDECNDLVLSGIIKKDRDAIVAVSNYDYIANWGTSFDNLNKLDGRDWMHPKKK